MGTKAPLGGLGVLLLLVAGAVGWVANQGVHARSDLEAARADLVTVRSALLSADSTSVQATVADAQSRARSAHQRTQDPLWRAATLLPWVGPSLQTASDAATVVDELATDVLPGLVALRQQLDPAKLRPAGDRIDLAPLAAAAPELQRLRQRTTAIGSEAAGLPTSGVPGVLAGAVKDLQTTLAETRSTLDTAALAAQLLPPMLGADGPRSYLLVLQSPDEARGTGGLVGGYGVLTASQGAIAVVKMGPNNDLQSLAEPALDLGPEYTALYGADPALWANVNLSPHFPYAGALMLEMWRRQFGQRLDGVIAVDPVVLSDLLAVSGPVTLASGEHVTAANVVALMEHDIYQRWPSPGQDAARGRYQMEIGNAVVKALLSGSGSPRALLEALGTAAGERRLLVYSARPSEQALVATTPLGGVLSSAPGPYAALVVNNGSGNKLDYYLDRSLSYVLGGCSTAGRSSVLTATLTNGPPPSGLPAYASPRLDEGHGYGPGHGGDGSTLEIVQVYGAVGAELVGATLDDAPVSVSPLTERGRPVFVLPVELAAGQKRMLRLTLVEPSSSVAPVAWVQPLIRPATVTVSDPRCS